MNKEFMDKVCDQIISETRVDDDELYVPFSTIPIYCRFLPSPFLPFTPLYFVRHCREIYSLNGKEIEYVWNRYKEGLTTLMDKKELSYE